MMQQTSLSAFPTNDYTYLFIDGGYVQKRYEEAVSVWFGDDAEEAEIDFSALIQKYPAGRSFYYYCLDEEQRKGESETDYQARIAKQKARLNKVREARGCHIRFGVIKGQEEKRRQKKVDVLLAVDMLTHAANKNMTKALLLAGDLDFQPAIESLVQLGIFVELIADDKHAASELTWAASSYTKLTFRDYYSWSASVLQRKYPLPLPKELYQSKLVLKEATVLKTGSLDGEAVTLYQADGKFYLCPPGARDATPIYLEHDALERIELYLEIQGKKIIWD